MGWQTDNKRPRKRLCFDSKERESKKNVVIWNTTTFAKFCISAMNFKNRKKMALAGLVQWLLILQDRQLFTVFKRNKARIA